MNSDLVLLDIETQRDFFVPSGSCYRPSADNVRRNVYALINWAGENDQPVISTVLRVRNGKIGPLADVPHCLEETNGEQKLRKTILRPYVNLGMRNSTDLEMDLFDHYRQVIFEKRHTDIFTHTRAERLISELSCVNFALCGAGVAGGIVQAALGLRKRGFGVILATDAVLDLDSPSTRMAYKKMYAKGVLFAKTSKIIDPSPKMIASHFFHTTTRIGRYSGKKVG